jgi:hypothetical protein
MRFAWLQRRIKNLECAMPNPRTNGALTEMEEPTDIQLLREILFEIKRLNEHLDKTAPLWVQLDDQGRILVNDSRS